MMVRLLITTTLLLLVGCATNSPSRSISSDEQEFRKVESYYDKGRAPFNQLR